MWHFRPDYCTAVLFIIVSIYAVRAVDEAIPLNAFPFVTSHDAASGEIDEARDHVVADWTRTQPVGLVGQLDCGSRAFDYRPYLSRDGVLLAHHGPVVIHKPMQESLKEISSWLSAPENLEEMVIMYITDCDGIDAYECIEETMDLLNSNDVYYIDNCEDVDGLTYGDAKNLGRLKTGGSLLSVIGCVDENYDVSIACYGYDPKYVCYDDESSKIAFQKIDDYMHYVTFTDPSVSTHLWMAQAHWQSDAYSISMGTLHNSSVIEDSNRSDLNNWVLQQLHENKWDYLNLLELDNVCNQGPAIQEVLLQSVMEGLNKSGR